MANRKKRRQKYALYNDISRKKCNASEGLYMDQAYATAVILLIFVLVLNCVSGFCAKHLSKATNGQ